MLNLLSLLLWLPALSGCGYLLLLTLRSRRPPAPPASTRTLRFVIVVPAHDEAAVIGRTLKSLRQLDWPCDRFRLLVVADNCSDATAELALNAGAEVVERNDPRYHGKGYALQLAFERCLHSGWADAIVVVDADSVVSPNLLEAFAARLEAGAAALQAHYGVLNPRASWRTSLMTLAQACFHGVRSQGREQLGLSSGLRGNGWCVSTPLLQRVPYAAFSLAEDVEYGIRIGLRGERVHYAHEAQVLGEMVSAAEAAVSQRRRWEDGRRQLRRTELLPLLQRSLARRDRVCLDLAADLLLPPLASLSLYVLVMAALSVLCGTSLWPAAFCLAALLAHVLRGWRLSGLGHEGLTVLVRVPAYVLWKLRVSAGALASREWVRTRRETP